jgi:hypothetical protein
MRLLGLEANGCLSLAEFTEREIPPYAILSHRWGRDQDEVTFKDVIENTGRNKNGYQKILSCGRQAARDGFEHFWVDTCCIDKTSSVELSEAINSMWRWYRDSKVCYAFLNDVAACANITDQQASLAASKWFTRGWTLQELLGPSKLLFFNAAWEAIGTREELADEISHITNIDEFYLRGGPISEASIAERMSWASVRETKRTEDIAYCLLGIFDISIPLLYGEGVNAFRRLQEEIIKQSDDHSIFAWEDVPRKLVLMPGRYSILIQSGLLAPSPKQFITCGNIVRSLFKGHEKPFAMTNRGLQIELPVLNRPGAVLAVLNCRRKHEYSSNIALHLRTSGGDQYWRATSRLRSVPIAQQRHTKFQSLYVNPKMGSINSRSDPKNGSCVIRDLPGAHVIPSDDDELDHGIPWMELKEFHPLLKEGDMTGGTIYVVPEGLTKRSHQTDDHKSSMERDPVLLSRPVFKVYPSSSWSPGTYSIAEDTERNDRTYSSLRLVSITSRPFGELAFVVFMRRYPSGVTWDARFIPKFPKSENEVQELYLQLNSANLSKLPRCQMTHSGTAILRSTPTSVGKSRIAALDVVLKPSRHLARLEVEEKALSFLQHTLLCYHLVITTYPLTAFVLIAMAQMWRPIYVRLRSSLFHTAIASEPSFFWQITWQISFVIFGTSTSPIGVWLYQRIEDILWIGQPGYSRNWERRWVIPRVIRWATRLMSSSLINMWVWMWAFDQLETVSMNFGPLSESTNRHVLRSLVVGLVATRK